MNTRGQILIFGIMMFMIAFIVVVILTGSIKEFVELARDSSHLDCGNATITTGTRMTCLIVDLYLPYFVAAVLAAGGTFLFIKQKAG